MSCGLSTKLLQGFRQVWKTCACLVEKQTAFNVKNVLKRLTSVINDVHIRNIKETVSKKKLHRCHICSIFHLIDWRLFTEKEKSSS